MDIKIVNQWLVPVAMVPQWTYTPITAKWLQSSANAIRAMAFVRSPEAHNGTTSLVINQLVSCLCANMTPGQGGNGEGQIPWTWTLTPGGQMDLNEEVPHIHSCQVTNQIMLIAKVSTRHNRIHLVFLNPIVDLLGHQWGPQQNPDSFYFEYLHISPMNRVPYGVSMNYTAMCVVS